MLPRFLLFLLCVPAFATTMWVATGVVTAYDLDTATPTGTVLTGSGFLYDVASRPGDPYLYVVDFTGGQILRFDPVTGLEVDVFASGLASPNFLEWRNDILYVSTGAGAGSNIRRFEADGTDLGDFVPGDLLNTPEQFAWDTNGDLYVTNKGIDDVVKYNGSTGELINALFATGFELDFPSGLAFGPDGNLYVTTWDPTVEMDGVLRYNGTTGALIGFFIEFPGDQGNALEFGPDGNLYVGSSTGVQRYNGTTGAFMDQLTAVPAGGIHFTDDVAVPEPTTRGLLVLGLAGMAAFRRRAR